MQKPLFENIQPLNSYQISVLLIDDQPMIAEAVRRSLQDERDIEFHYCSDPTKAIKIANQIKPTIILQDLVMPEVNGLMMVKFFRVNKETAQVPIIILSTKEDPKIKSEAFAVGVNDYIVKLPDKIELIARIRYHSEAYIYHRQRDEAFLALQESQRQLNRANRSLEKLSSLDGLTGIANRRQFDSVLEKEWLRAMRNGSNISLLMLDIDYFKLYNDTYGHQGGDSCLKVVANILKESENRPADLAARYGGEEFCIILPETGETGVKDIAQSVLDRIRKTTIPHKSSKVSKYLSASIGTATMIPGRDTNPDKIIEIADKALYKAKNDGRDRVVTTPRIGII
nr:diguanylate cyclase [Desulfobulbaceae bacterium]